MFEKNYYTLRGVADELNIGESTIQYWQDQYHSWIPCKGNDKEKWYTRQSIGILRFIIESANAGMTEGDIQKELSNRYPMVNESYKQDMPHRSIESGMQVMHGDSVSGVLKGLLEGLSRQQMRIADAQERRAVAEERKAAALEKRAEAQKLMADALNNVADALQHTTLQNSGGDFQGALKNGRSVISDNLPGQIKADHEIVASDEDRPDNELQESVIKSLLDDVLEDNASSEASNLDDLSELLEDSEETSGADTDDLTDLLMNSSEEGTPELDDLSELLEDSEANSAADTDDLSELLTSSSEETESELDDLSELLEDSEANSAADTDDLSELLAGSSEETESELDDLSELLNSAEEVSTAAKDNLPEPMKIASEVADKHENNNTAMPDVPGKAEKQATAIPDEQTKKIPGDYKSKIIALIIQLKEKKGMGVNEVTEHMNAKGYKTISGKEKWDSKTITQIFEHIKMVRSENE